MFAPPIAIENDRLRIHFRQFGAEAYKLFLRAKALPEYEVEYFDGDESYAITAPARFASLLGVESPRPAKEDLPLSPFLFDDQAAIVQMALDGKRFACWSDCGLGKTVIGLEFARHVVHRAGKRVLIFTLNEIVPQWAEESAKFYGDALPVRVIKTRQEMRDWCAGKIGDEMLAVVNYEKMNPDKDGQVVNELRHLGGVICDEAHRLKTGGGKQKWAIIKSCKGIEYKLSLTATPAPNDTMEFASQAAFLEKMRDESDIIWTYFRRDAKTRRWAVKPNARDAFFRFMAAWSIYVRDPRRYGWRKDHQEIPPPILIERKIEATPEQLRRAAELLGVADGLHLQMAVAGRETNAIERMKLAEIAKGFEYVGAGKNRITEWLPSEKPAVVGEMAEGEERAGAQVLVWTTFDAETELLAKEFEGRGLSFSVLTGKTTKKRRAAILEDFRAGKVRTLIGRASMLGHGMNFQFVKAMIFSGWSDSYVAYYQAVRRAYRFGQADRIRVYVPFIQELERDMWDNVLGKDARNMEEIELMERSYVEATRHLRGAA